MKKFVKLKSTCIIRNDGNRAIIYAQEKSYYDTVLNDEDLPLFKVLSPLETAGIILMDGTRKEENIINEITKLGEKLKISDENIQRATKETKENIKKYADLIDNKSQRIVGKVTDFLPDLSKVDYNWSISNVNYPLTLLILPTLKCYTDCKYCYADRSNKSELDIEVLSNLLKKYIPKYKFKSLSISGGDIFKYKHYKEFLSLIAKYGYYPDLATKVPLDKEKLNFLKKLGFNSFQYSLDTFNPETISEHLKINNSEEYLKRIDDSIRYADSIGLKVAINCILTKEIVPDLRNFLKKILTYDNIYRLGISPMAYSYYLKQNMKTLMLSRKEIKEIHEINKDLFSELNDKIPLFKAPDENSSWGFSDKISSNDYKDKAICTGLRTSYVILPSGDVTACEELYFNNNFIIGNINNQSLDEISLSEKRWNLIEPKQNDFPESSPCKHCDEKLFNLCNIGKGRCWRDAMKFFNDGLYMPDPKCPYFKEISKKNNIELNYDENIWTL